MASAVRTTFLGKDYQHLYFWIEACRLFHEGPTVSRVGIEKLEVRAFDDVTTIYKRPIYDKFNRLIDGDYFQLKYHVDYEREIRGLDLVKPQFIGAQRYSLFDRLVEATAKGNTPKRLTLITPWDIDNGDPLRRLVSPRSGEIVLDHLFSGSATREMRELRETWRRALGDADDDQMRAMLRHLVIRHNVQQWQLEGQLDWSLHCAGLAPIDKSQLTNKYLALSEAFIKGRDYEHDVDALGSFLRQEGLWIGSPAPVEVPRQPLAIQSFSPFAVHLEDEAKVLNLLPFFHGREIAKDVAWPEVFESVHGFLLEQIRPDGEYELNFDTHLSVGFAAGRILDKAGPAVLPVQRLQFGKRMPWSDEGDVPAGGLWEQPCVMPVGEGPETAVAIEVTQPVAEDVALYLKNSESPVGRIVVFRIAGGPSRTSVVSGAHAHALARTLGKEVTDLRKPEERHGPLHLFAAAPVALAFLLGREATPWGPTISYEYDFDTRAPGAYSPTCQLPLMREGN